MDPTIIDELWSANRDIDPQVESAKIRSIRSDDAILRRRLARLDMAQEALRLALLDENPKRLSRALRDAIEGVLSV